MENCFGSISTELAIRIIDDDFERVIRPHTNMEREDFIELLRICLNECNYLLFKGQLYRQLNGIFMGSSLGSIIVQIVSEHIVDSVLRQLKEEKIIPPTVWLIYVDDHLVICNENVIGIILDRLNAFDPGRIKFTCELEQNQSINFLDLTIIRRHGSIVTNWYSKAIASNRMLNYYSAHPRKMILNVVKSFVSKVLQYSHTEFHPGNLVKIKGILTKNSFPNRVIHHVINAALKPVAPKTRTGPASTPSYCSLTYVPKLSEQLISQIKYFMPDVTVANKPEQKLDRMYSKQKDKLDDDVISGIVYELNCLECDAKYIGETNQKKCTRRQQHKNSTSVTNLAKTNVASALALHAKQTTHRFDFDNMKTLERNSNKKKLQIAEVNHIIMNMETACNFKKDTSNIAPSYINLLRNYANKDTRINKTNASELSTLHESQQPLNRSTLNDRTIACT